MRVQSWGNLLVTLLAVAAFIRELLRYNGPGSVVTLALTGYMILQGLLLTFSREEYEESLRLEARSKRANRKLYGRFAPLAPYLPLGALLLGGVVAMIVPDWTWLIGLLLLAAPVSAIWLKRRYDRQMDLEEQLESDAQKNAQNAP